MKIRTYLQSLIKSITSLSYYLDILNAPFSFSLKFFLVGYLLLAVLATIFFVQIDSPKYQTIFNDDVATIQKNFPNDLQIKWDGNTLSSSTNQPISLSYPNGIPHEQFPDQLAYLVPTATTIDQATQIVPSSSMFILTKDKIFVSNAEGGWSQLALKDTPGFDQPFEVNQTTLPHYLADWRILFSQVLRSFSYVFPFAFFFGTGLIRFLGVLVNSVFVFYVLKLLNKSLPFKKIMQLCMHVSVVASLLDLITAHLSITSELNMYGIAFWLYLILVLFSLWNVKNVAIFRSKEKHSN